MRSAGPIVLLGGDSDSTRIVYHALAPEFAFEQVILTREPARRGRLLRRRVRKLGLGRVAGQLVFQTFVVPVLRHTARARLSAIGRAHRHDPSPIDEAKVTRVASVNSEAVARALMEIQPRVVVVNGTAIISARVLRSVPAQFINIHAGITPLYRGVHGAYWALYEGRPFACGVTIHRVDAGIDTGGILKQAVIHPTAQDSFVTYPLLQLAAGIPLLKEAIREALEGRAETIPPPEGPSRLWSHPTVLEYLRGRLRAGVQ